MTVTLSHTRDSNGELVRLVCMFMIVVHHFCVHLLYPEVLGLQLRGAGWDSHVVLLLHGFVYVGVNCFVLLSGYYGIRLRLRSVLNLYAICAFYAALLWVRHAAGQIVMGGV